MYRGTIALCSINKYMKLRFNLVIKDDTAIKTTAQKYINSGKVIEKFTFEGSEYLRISPKPYVTIDISATSDKNDTWSSNNQVNLNKFCLFDFMMKVRNMLNKFKIKDLYYIQNGKLNINNDVAKQNFEVVRTPNKVIKMIHAVVYDAENKEMEYEGICFMINSVDNFCCLTYTELEYLYYELNKINMHELSMSLINSYLTTLVMNRLYTYKPKELVINKVKSEEKQEEPPSIPIPAKIEPPSEIPQDI